MSYIGTIKDVQFHPMEEQVPSYILFTVFIANLGNETVKYESDLNTLIEKFDISVEDNYEYDIPDFKGRKCEVQPANGFFKFVRFVD